MKVKNLKLIARTVDDLRVVSAHLQDAIVSISDIANLENNKILLIQLNRFMWEDVEKGLFRKNKRIRTVLKIENVIKVHSKNIIQSKKDLQEARKHLKSTTYYDRWTNEYYREVV